MYLRQRIKHISFGLMLLFVTSAFGQSDSVAQYVPSPYTSEYNPWFKFSKFQRGFKSDSVTGTLDRLEQIPRKNWSRKDSLSFGRASLQTGNLDLAQYYFSYLNPDFEDESPFWWDQMILYIQIEDYEAGIESIHKNSPGILELSKIYFLDRFLLAYIAQKKDEKWYKSHSVLNWKADSSLFDLNRNSETYQNKVITPLENLDFVLKLLIHYNHEEDPIIARACFEMGLILEDHVSLTQAYIAYSLGRHFNKWDKEILNAVKDVKAKLSQRKYKIPIFRRYFPRIEKWRFDYDVLKEKIILEKKDTIQRIAPNLMLEKEKPPIPFPPQLIVIGGIFLLFILVLLFLRTRKGK